MRPDYEFLVEGKNLEIPFAVRERSVVRSWHMVRVDGAVLLVHVGMIGVM